MGTQANDSLEIVLVKGTILLFAINLAGFLLIANTALNALLSQHADQSPVGRQILSCREDEKILVSYSDGVPGSTTEMSYSGLVYLTIEGSGQASGAARSDAFYIYTNGHGEAIPPEHPQDWILTINSQLAHHFIEDHTVPDYNSNHIYQVEIIAPGGPLQFGIDDGYTPDNNGALIVSICQQ